MKLSDIGAVCRLAAMAMLFTASNRVVAEEFAIAGDAYTFTVTAENNNSGNRLDILRSGTLKLSGAATDGVYLLKLNLNFTNDYVTADKPATLTVEFADAVDCSTVRMTGHIRNAGGGGKIHFPQGVKSFVVGSINRNSDDAINFTAFQGDVSFEDADGSVVFTNDVSLANLPKSCPYGIEDGSRIAIMGKEVLGDGDFTISSYDVELGASDSFAENATITVPDGKKLLVRPVLFTKDYNGTWGGGTGGFDNNVFLGGSGAHIDFLNNNNGVTGFTGEISGRGNVYLKGNGNITFKGKLSYEGALVANKAKSYALNLESGSAMVPAVVAEIAGTKFLVNPDAGASEDKALSMNSFTAQAGVSEINVAGNTALDIVEVAGGVRLTASDDKASVHIGSLVADSVLYVSSGVALTLESAAPGAKVVFEADAEGEMDWSLAGPSDGDALEIAVEFPEDADSAATLALGGKVAIPEDYPISAASLTILEGAKVSAVIANGTRIENRGGELAQLAPKVTTWKEKVALWTDASAENTFAYAALALTNELGVAQNNPYLPNENAIIEWLDCRPGHRGEGKLRFRQIAFDGSIKPSKDAHKLAFPFVSSIDGVSVVSNALNRGRIQIATGKGSDNMTNVKTKFALFVFNGSNGGGTAFFTTKDGVLKRVDTPKKSPSVNFKSKPLIYENPDNKISFRTNGVDIVAPVDTPITGGWQLMSFASEEGVEVTGFGHAATENTADHNGGQIFAEIMLFDTMPTEDERNAAEIYLAEKYALPLHGMPEKTPVSMGAYGNGTISLESDAVMTTGFFGGTVNLNGNRLELTPHNLPATEATMPEDGRELWIDPSLEGAVVLGEDAAKPDEVAFIHARDNNGLLKGADDRCVASPYSDNGEKRRVRLVEDAKAPNAASAWLDFRNGYDDDYRNHLQVKEKLSTPIPVKYNDTDVFKPIPVKAGFFALDTSRSGGSVICTSVNASGGFGHRTGSPSVSTPIWRDNCSDQVQAADTYLDGVKTDATKKGYNGRPEVMSFNMQESAKAEDAKVFGYSGSTTATSPNYEIMGEWILYSKTLDDDTRRSIEAYLMRKWLGKQLDGFSDFRSMTVVGAGVLAAEGPEFLPELTDAFTGTLEFSHTAWEFTLPKDGGDAAVDAVDLSGRGVMLPSAIAIKLDAKGAQNGTYSLFKAGAFSGVKEVSLAADSNLGTKYVALSVSETEISVRVMSRGLKLTIK